MPPHSKPLAPIARGEKAGRLAASEMIKTLSPETSSVEGVVRRIEQVGIIVARGHQEAGMRAADVQACTSASKRGCASNSEITCAAFDRPASPPPREQIGAGLALKIIIYYDKADQSFEEIRIFPVRLQKENPMALRQILQTTAVRSLIFRNLAKFS